LQRQTAVNEPTDQWRDLWELLTAQPTAASDLAVTPACLLCQAPKAYIGLFLPQKPVAWGALPGKERVFVYGLCGACSTLPDITMHVEARFQQDLVGQRH